MSDVPAPRTPSRPPPDQPEPPVSAIRRSLARARDGKPLDPAEATVAAARPRRAAGPSCSGYAGRVRDAGLAAAGRPGVITYSRKVFIPLTRLCRDRCHYCTFVTVPGRLPTAPYLSPGRGAGDRPRRARRSAARRRCSPSATGRRTAGRQAREWLDAHGYDDTLSYVRAMAIRGAGGDRAAAAPEPRRADAGRSFAAAQAGRAVDGDDAGDHRATGCSPSQGGPHFGCPDKDPAVRLRVLEDAGRSARPVHHRHPGRHRRDAGRAGRVDLRDPPGGPRVRRHPGSDRAELPGQAGHRDARRARRRPGGPGRHDRRRPAGARPVACASRRRRTSSARRVPAAPAPPAIDDWGGVSPLTPDHVNPERPWPHDRRPGRG